MQNFVIQPGQQTIVEDYKISVEVCSRVVALTVETNAVIAKKAKSISHKQETSTDRFYVGLAFFEEHYGKCKDNPFKLMDKLIPENCLNPVTQKFFDAYQEGRGLFHDSLDELSKNYKKISLTEDTAHLFVKNRVHHNNVMYDADGKPIWRKIHMDYINSGATSKSHNFKALHEHLLKHPQVSKLSVIEIPYYNASFYGEKGLEFTFSPNNEEFEKLISEPLGNFKVKEILEFDKFEQEEVEETFHDDDDNDE